MTIFCPHEGCGKEMWVYDHHLYTCRAGHKMAQNHVLPATPRIVEPTHIIVSRPLWWQDHRIGYALAAVLAVAQIVEVLL